MTIGIGVTTRNRPELFRIWCERIIKNAPMDACIFAYDDNSDDPGAVAASAHRCGISFEHGMNRVGVAKAKNRVLEKIRHCEHIFLFEDDCWPTDRAWVDQWLGTAEAHGAEALNACHPNGTADAHIVSCSPCHSNQNFDLVHVSQSNGYCMYWTREALDVLGWYDERMGICGGEDTQINLRAWKANLKPSAYCGPKHVGRYLYSVDLDWIWAKQKRLPPGMTAAPDFFSGSVLTSDEKGKGWSAGAQFVHCEEIFIGRQS